MSQGKKTMIVEANIVSDGESKTIHTLESKIISNGETKTITVFERPHDLVSKEENVRVDLKQEDEIDFPFPIQENNSTSNRGGAREGAGRPKKDNTRFWGVVETSVAEKVIEKYGSYSEALRNSIK